MCIRDRLYTGPYTINRVNGNNTYEIVSYTHLLRQAQTNLGTRCEEITATVNDVRDQVYSDKEKMTEVQQREFNNFREEINLFRSQPIQMTGIPNMDNRDTIISEPTRKIQWSLLSESRRV